MSRRLRSRCQVDLRARARAWCMCMYNSIQTRVVLEKTTRTDENKNKADSISLDSWIPANQQHGLQKLPQEAFKNCKIPINCSLCCKIFAGMRASTPKWLTQHCRGATHQKHLKFLTDSEEPELPRAEQAFPSAVLCCAMHFDSM